MSPTDFTEGPSESKSGAQFLPSNRTLATRFEREARAIEALLSSNVSAWDTALVHLQRMCLILLWARGMNIAHASKLVSFIAEERRLDDADYERLSKIIQEVVQFPSADIKIFGLADATQEDLSWCYQMVAQFGARVLKLQTSPLGSTQARKKESGPSILFTYRRWIFWFCVVYAFGFLLGGHLNPIRWFYSPLTYEAFQKYQGWGKMEMNRSVTGTVMSIAGDPYLYGIGTHAESRITLRFRKQGRILSGKCGIDDATGNRGSVKCQIFAGPKLLFTSGVIRGGDLPVSFEVPIDTLSSVDLVTTDGEDDTESDHVDWVNLEIR